MLKEQLYNQEVEKYPLTSYQKDVWTEQCLYKNKPIYNIGGYVDIKGNINYLSFQKAVQKLIGDNDSLRIRIEEHDGKPFQKVLKKIEYKVPFYDFSSKEYSEKFSLQWMQEEFLKPFDFNSNDNLFEIVLIKVNENRYFYFSRIHHIISDGWGHSIIVRELVSNYNEIDNSQNEIEKHSYLEFVKDNKSYRESDKYLKDREFWKDKFKCIPQNIFVRNIKSNKLVFSNRESVTIKRNTYNQIMEYCTKEKCSVFHFFLGVLGTYFSRVSNSKEVVIGVPILNRTKASHKQIVGHFANVIPLKIEVSKKKSFLELMNEIKMELKACYRHQKLSFGEIYTSISKDRDQKLFDITLSYENHNYAAAFNGTKTDIKTLSHRHERNALAVFIREFDEDKDVEINFDYAIDAFEKFIPIENVVTNIKHLVENIIKDSDKNINDIDVVTDREKHRLLVEFNDTKADYPRNKTINELFEKHAEKAPDDIAVVYEDKKMSYKELNERANSLARALREKGVGKDVIVGMLVERSVNMIVGIMGILKAGGAYMPIDPDYPEDRIEYTLENSKATIVLTQDKFKDKIKNKDIKICDINNEEFYKYSSTNLGKTADSNSLAYIIYTSGTTGKPKGVMIEHNNVVRLMFNDKMPFDFSNKDIWTMFHSYCFDFSVWEMYGALLYGGRLIVVPKIVAKDSEKYLELLKKEKVTVLNQTPSAFYNLMNIEANSDERKLNLRYIVFGGEALNPQKLSKWKQKYEETKIINMYGITETTVHVTFKEITSEDIEKGVSNIGKPIPTLTTYVMNEDLKIQPIGIAGELCVGGDGVARGYLNNEKLTAEKFVKNPYNPKEKIYRSGDLVRVLPDGNMEYIGRIDHQVKIRGFRIELGEIENRLLKIEGIKETVVLAKGEVGSKYLCAYYVGEKEYTVGELREELKKSLPDYMVPAYFIKLESMPLTPNGKVDRKVLPEPQGKINTGAEYEAPRNELEEKLVEIWQGVLGVTNIGINDDFFELGGHSLNATTLIGRIYKKLNVEIPLREIFSKGNIKGLSEYIEAISKKEYEEIERVDEKQYYEASSAQKRTYMLQEIDKDSTVYNMPGALEIEGRFEIDRMQEAFIKLINRHETLRTSFYLKDGKIVQRINKANEIQFKIEKIEIKNEEEVKEKFEEFIRPFDLEKAPLLRVGIIKLEKERHIMFFDMHHIVSDGVSIAILTREISDLYAEKDLGELKIQYKDYSAWQLKKNESEELKKQEQYWLKEFSDEVPVLSLPTDYKRPKVKDFKGRSINFVLDKETTEKLRKIAKETGSTMYMVLLANINILLSKYSGQEDIVVGSPIAGRNHADLENLIGMFVNTLAIRSIVNNDLGFSDYLKIVRNKALKAYENQDYQFEEIVDKIDIDRDLGRNPLFDVMFILENMEEYKIEIENSIFKPYKLTGGIEKFDITIDAREVKEEICFNLSYATSLYKYETIKRMINHFLNIVKETTSNEEIKIKDIEILSEEERSILEKFNDTEGEYPEGKVVSELFEMQVEKTPDNIAVVYENQSLTYKELNERANSLGRTLRKKGVGAESVVGIMVKRSLEMIVGIMGILKAGGAYMPIDPEYPDDRIEYMLENSETKLVLVQNEFKDRINKNNVEVCRLDDEELYKESNANLGKTASAKNLAYVIYTSGTTGKPKGVMIEHKGIVNRINWMQKKYNISSKDVILQKTTYTFDVSVWEILWWSFVGAQVRMLVPGGEKDPSEITKSIKEGKVTVLHFVPSMLNVFMDYVISEGKVEDIESLEKVFTSGEALKVEQANIFNKEIGRVNNTRLINLYGPTEASVDVTYYECREKEEMIPIGKPIDNTKIYIVDKNNKMLPIGVAGELCISGCGVARGYLNNEKLTNEKFAENPYEPGEKMYRTGDLARWLPDGNIEYLGRIDHQVKIRGFRIELGEIESNILKLEGIKETIVLARDGAVSKYLCAYYVGEKDYSVGEFREELKKSMPDYMVPAYFIKLESMPLTLNGKINRKALPEPQGKIDTGSEYEAPRNEIEQKLVQIWEKVLGIDNIGINDDFFSLGGDSIKSIQVISRAKAKGYYFEVKDVFNNSNIKALSKCVKKNDVTISQDEVVGEVELTPIQKWFFEMNFEEEHHWNQSVMLFSKDGFEKEALEKAFEAIIIHHDALRMVYKNENGEIHQINRGTSEKLYDLNVYEGLSEKEVTEKCDEIQGSINLHDGPLVKLGLFKTHEGDHLLVAIHHLVIDGVSWRILFEDLSKAYEMAKNGEDIILQDKTTSFKEWASEQSKYATSSNMRKQLEYWSYIDKCDVRKLPKDKEVAVARIKDLRSVGFNLTKEETEKLLKHVNKAYNTEIEDLLLTALALTISKWTGEENILVNLESHGREEILKNVDITRTIGWFTSQYPIVLSSSNEELGMMIKNTKDSLRRIPNKGIEYGIIKYLSNNPINDKLKPEICFNYLGQFDEDINNNIFKVSSLSSGSSIGLNNKSLYLLDFSAILIDKNMNLNLRYNAEEYNDETIKALINDYKDNLTKIIKHCMGKDKTEKTAADITKENIRLQELSPYLKDIDNIKNIYPLTPMQEGMLYHTLADDKPELYNEQLAIKIKGHLDIELLKQSFNKLVQRHDVLRTTFDYENFNKNMQIVFKERTSYVEYKDVSKEKFDKELYIKNIMSENRKKGFNLSKDALIKLIIVKIERSTYSLILNNHHIIMDGWCLNIIMMELFKVYNELKYGYKAALKDVVPYSEYIEWLNNRDEKAAKEYWKNYLLGYNEATLLPFKNNKVKREYKDTQVDFVIEKDVTKKLQTIARNNKVTINTILQSIWSILLQKYNNSSDSVFGYVVSGRNPEVKGIENMLGLFINTVPLRVKTKEDTTFKELLANVNKSFIESSKYDFYPLADTQALSEIGEKLINNIMIFENYPVDSEGINNEILTKNDLQIIGFKSEEQTNYNFNVIVSYQDNISIKFNFNESLYSENNVIKIKEHFENLVKQIIENEEVLVKDIEIINEEEKHRLLVEFNDTKADYPRNKTINELFEKHAEKAPDDIAVVYEDKKMSYKELNERANSLARALREKGVGKDVIVGMLVERSVNMIVGIMGILKAGGAYMPIDPDYPEDRIEYTLENSKATIVLTQDKFKDKIKNKDIKICDINNEEFYKYSSTNLGKTADSNSLAYIIYTSGTTGKPKGVMIEHNNVVRLMFNDKMPFNFSNKDVWTMFHSYCFDFSVWEMYGALLYGGRLIVVPKIVAKDSEKYLELLKKEKVTVLNQTPSAFYNLMNIEANSDERKLNLRYIVFGGEALNPQKLSKWKQKYEETKIINMYGITETTVHVTFKEITSEDIEKGVSNIGKPIPTLTTYVMNEDLKIQPIGIAGELCVGGDGVARGYLNNEKLTAEKFVKNPYNPKEKIYRSGDLVRVLPDGNMEYIGRIDHQVKIRGFRIELGEIENRLLKIEGIKETVVLAKGEVGSKYLCAYYVGEKEYTVGELREELKKSLPDYMVPAYFIKLESMPLTPNGKVDRKVLPEPQGKINTGAEYEAPRNELEEKLVEIWQNVLGVTNIGINDDFFELGGHSLSATTLAGRIFKVLNVEVPLKEIFSNGNIKGLSEYIETISSKQYEAIEKVEEKEYYEASSAQKRMYMLQELDQNSTAYNMPRALEILGEIEIEKIKNVFIKLIERHETLRTSFYTKADKIVQRINKTNDIQFEIEKIEIKNEEEVKEKFEEFIRPFDLKKAPLLRVGIIKLEKERHIMFFDMHHIASDGVSMSILTKEFSKLYSGKELGELKVQYKDYSAWQLKKNESEELKKQEQYWLKEFSDEVPVLSLPTDYKRPRVKDFKGRSINFVLDKETTEKLRKIAKETGSTMYMVLLANINILLSKYSGQEDIVVGSPIAGRNHADLENLIGMFVNTLAIRSKLNDELSFSDYLKIVRNKALKAYENQDYQFEEIVDKIDIDRDLGRNPLFDVMFILENMEEYKIEIENSIFKPYKLTGGIEKFDITIDAREVKEEICFNLSYATSLYKYETIKRMINHFLNIVKETTSNEEIKIKDIELMDEEEKHKLLIEFNDTKAAYPREKTINELFEEGVEKTPDNIAVVCEDKKLTYKELNERANSLARVLKKKGVGAESIVGIMVDRSFEMIVGIMGILKAGGAYMPIDPEYPDDRIEYMLENSETKLVLVQNKFKDRINKNNVEVCRLNDEELYKESNANLGKTASAKNLAYVIYTSGTTGKPKGVMINHSSVINTLMFLQKNYPMDKEGAYLQKTNYVFDVSVSEIFGWFIGGGKLIVLNNGYEKDAKYILKSIIDNSISHINFTSSMFNLFLNELDNNIRNIESLKYILTAGEALRIENNKVFKDLIKSARIENLYGPTEATVYSTKYSLKDVFDNIPIGKPIDNAKMYIVDKNTKLVPMGVVGELCIGGDGLARGYLNNKELTEEKFAENPYEPGQKIYRTGDLARWLPDGNIEYLGRIDHQVKIRGFRIELGEIESNLLKIEGIKEVVVLAKEKAGNNYLCAYYIGEKEYSVGELREELKRSIPDYMLPSYFIKLESMPLTPNGKVDRGALPEPHGKINTGAEYEAPRNEVEKQLVEIWQDVLDIDEIGINDDFFSLGGDSIKSIQVISRAKAKGYYFEVKDVFNNSNIKALSKCVKKNAVTISQDEVVGEVELTPIQKRFFEKNFEEKQHWNQAVMLFSKDGFEKEILEKVFKAIIIHHDALRMVYKNENGEVHQINRGTSEKLYDLNVYEGLNEEEITEKCNKIQDSINLEEGPLVKLGLFKTHKGDHLLIAIHHLVIDGVSWRILFEDLSKAYEMAKNGEDIILQDKTTSFKEWAVEQKKYADSYSIRKQLEYWNGIDKCDIRKLPKDKEAAVTKMADLRSIGFNLTQQQTESLLKNVNNAYNTEINDILLTALGLTISKWTGSENTLVNLEGHGREEIIKNVDITRTVGWFTSQYPVVLNSNNDDLGTTIKNIKDSLRRVPSKGIGYGIIKYLSKDKMEFRLKPEISFNYLGQFDEDINNDIFNMSPLSSGNSIGLNNKGLYSLDFSGILIDKKLNIDIRYNDKEYKDETIKKLIQEYRNNLITIIEHCMNKDKSEKTAADVTKEDITLQQLKPYLKDIDNIKNIYPLTPMQEGMLYHALADNESEAYNEELVIKIKGQLDIELLKQSFNRLVERHDILRTAFDYENFNRDMQIVFYKRKADIRYVDISGKKFDKKDYIDKAVKNDKKQGFDLNKDVLIKLTIIKTEEDVYNLILNNHHIIMDGWCLNIIMLELFKIYNELKFGYKAKLEEAVPYSEYIEWLNNKDREAAKDYWTNYLADYAEAAIVPFQNKENSKEYKKSEVAFEIKRYMTKKLEVIARENKVTINTIMQSVWALLIQKYNNSNDSVFGYVVSGRTAEVKGIESMLGLFINTVPLRVKTEGNMTFKELLTTVNKSFLESSEYDFYPLAEIQGLSDVKEKLVNNIMVFENYPVDSDGINNEILTKNDLKIVDVKAQEQTNYNFNLLVIYQDTISIKFNFNEAVYSKDNVLKIKDHFENLVSQIIKDEEIKIKDIEILSEEERSILEKFNDTEGEYPEGKVVSELFEMQVEKTPDNIAVVYENQSLTYKELNERANSLGRTLRKKGVGAESVVGIMVKRSLEMIVGIMGILKAGGAYMPIDPEYPDDRIEYMLENSETKLVLVQNEFKDRINKNNVEVCRLSDEELYKESNANLGKTASAKNLAYVIYTSGTTGKPKGVMIEHKGIVNRINWMQKKYNISSKDVILQKTTYTFDVSVWEILWWSFVGAQVRMLVPGGEKDPSEITKSIKEGKVTVLHFVPSMLNVFMDYVISEDKVEDIESLEKVFTSGEALKVEQANIFNKEIGRVNNTRLINLYGPTEASVDVTYYECREKEEMIPIGKPIDNTKIYIVDKNNKMLPIGVAGELCISGCGVARGYLNNEKLTNEKFAENPYEPGEKMYRTGDLARWLPDGNIEYLGRIDHQVKIRGFRIELGEIESNILKLEGIKETIVLARDGAVSKYLCAYYVGEKDYSVGEFREELKKSMPDYMVPAYFIKLESMPLTLNGKINRKALPEPQGKIDTGSEYEAPRNEIEQKLVQIWEDVLGVQDIGINDNFFELGGHSLKATTLVGRIYKVLNVEVPLKEIFSKGNIKVLSEYIDSVSRKEYEAIEKVEEKEYYEASSAQKRMYMLQELDKNSTAYNMPGTLEILGDFDIKRMQEAFIKLIERHEVLRTSFYSKGDKIVQKITKIHEMNFEIEQIEVKSEEEVEKKFQKFIRPFELDKVPLLRAGIIKLEEKRHVMFFDMHHIVSDGVSMSILTREFSDLYAGKELGELKVQYKDYSAWQLKKRESEDFKKQEEYWLKEFSGEIPVLNLPTDYKRPKVKEFSGSSINFVLDKETTERLREIAKETGSTMYMVLMANINILLSKYSGQEDIIIGSPIAGRSHVDLENVIGMFVNTLAIRSNVNGEASFKEYLKTVKSKALKAFENQEYQFEELVDKIDVDRDLSRNPLFDIVFVLQNMEEAKIKIKDLTFKPYDINDDIEKFDMTMMAVEGKEEIYFKLSYATSIYKEETIERMINHFLNIVKVTVRNIEVKLKDIEIVSEEEKRKLLVEFNDTSVEYSKDKTITELFEEQVERTPKNTAVVFKDEKLTYKELNEKANSLARVIAQKGICQDDIVGIMVENSIDMIVGIMAILKAGGAYLPIDPEYPEDRIEYMLENSKTNIVLTKGKLKEKIAGDKREIYDLDNEELYKESKSNLGKTSKANNLAYVIYTSGTTGKPKGVMMEHKGLVNLSLWHNRYYEVTEEDRVTKYAGVGFDASVWEIFPYIIAGAAIHVIYDSIRLNIQLLNDYYEKNKITISFLPTQIFEQFIQQKNQSLRKLLTGADRLKVYKEQTYELINNYGPTENAVVTTSFRIDKEYRNIPIGRPIDNVRIYIVDENNKLLPIGVAGELCVSGDGLARGYINNEELTKEKFVANPYESGQRMYRTGDLARWLPNGNIEYLGRIDHQVKIRGFRIELGEIENNLLKLEEIKEVVVLAREKEENKYLCAYYVGEKEYNISEVREELKKSLPDYMIPAYFIKLESMPLTPNGKVDRKALPEPDGKINTGVKYEAPRNELEKQLVEIWEDVLGVCDIGINDNFFEIGGHSLKATTLIGRIYKNLNIEVPLKEIFTRGSIKGLSEYIESINKKEYEAIERVEEQECYEASSAQKRMYMLQELDKYSTAYNVPGSLEVLGKFEIERMQETFIKLIERHETLRTSFYTVDNKIVQMVNKASEIQFEIEKIEVRTEEEIQEKIKEFIRPFDLGTAPLLRVAVIKLEEERYIMLFDMHHIVSDGVSMSILTKEFSKLYSGKDLGELKVQYKDYSAWQLNKKASEEYKRQEEYWLQEFSREIPVLKLPTDYARPKTKDFKGDSISFVLDKETTESLRNIAKKTETTMYMVLLANINVLLSKYSEQEDIVVGSPIAGRNHVDLENLIGVFVNTLAIRSHVNSGLSFKEYLKTVKNKALKAYENQDYQFEELASKVEKYRDLSRNPLFDVMFVLENVGEAKIEVEGLTFKPYILSNKMEKLDITIAASEGTEEIKFNFSYATSLYKRETMEDMIKCFKHIIKVSSSNLDIAIKDISVMTNSEAYDFLSKTKSSNFNKDDFDFDFED